MFHHLEYKKAVSNSALCAFMQMKTKALGQGFLRLGNGTMFAPRCWNLRQGYPIGIAYCAKVSVAPWAQKQHNTFPSS
jgi:hypothetical protein